MAKPNWIDVNPISGINNRRLTITAIPNNSSERSGVLTVSGEGIIKSINIIQNKMASKNITYFIPIYLYGSVKLTSAKLTLGCTIDIYDSGIFPNPRTTVSDIELIGTDDDSETATLAPIFNSGFRNVGSFELTKIHLSGNMGLSYANTERTISFGDRMGTIKPHEEYVVLDESGGFSITVDALITLTINAVTPPIDEDYSFLETECGLDITID